MPDPLMFEDFPSSEMGLVGSRFRGVNQRGKKSWSFQAWFSPPVGRAKSELRSEGG